MDNTEIKKQLIEGALSDSPRLVEEAFKNMVSEVFASKSIAFLEGEDDEDEKDGEGDGEDDEDEKDGESTNEGNEYGADSGQSDNIDYDDLYDPDFDLTFNPTAGTDPDYDDNYTREGEDDGEGEDEKDGEDDEKDDETPAPKNESARPKKAPRRK